MPHFRTWDNINYDYHSAGDQDTFEFKTENGGTSEADGGPMCIDRFEFVLMESGAATSSDPSSLLMPIEDVFHLALSKGGATSGEGHKDWVDVGSFSQPLHSPGTGSAELDDFAGWM